MELIKDTVKSVIQSLAAKQSALPGMSAEAGLKNILTKKEFRHIRINHFRNGVLTLNVDSSAWLYHFNLSKEELLEKLRRGTKEIKDIRFYLGDTK